MCFKALDQRYLTISTKPLTADTPICSLWEFLILPHFFCRIFLAGLRTCLIPYSTPPTDTYSQGKTLYLDLGRHFQMHRSVTHRHPQNVELFCLRIYVYSGITLLINIPVGHDHFQMSKQGLRTWNKNIGQGLN